MSPSETQELLARVERLESRNRLMTRLCVLTLLIPGLAMAGWQSASGDAAARVRRLEIVDERGVPMVVLSAEKEGGQVLLRDSSGEKRAWFQAGKGTAALTLNSEGPNGTGDSTLGLSVGPSASNLSMISRKGATFSAGMAGDSPKLEMYGVKGNPLFVAPWTNP